MRNKKNISKKNKYNKVYIIAILFLCTMIFREFKAENREIQHKIYSEPSKLSVQGNIIWSYLHTISVRYRPTEGGKEEMKTILKSISNFLICSICGNHWEKIIEESDLDDVVKDRKNLMLWLCEKHNEINQKLGKEIFDCKIEKIFEKWG